MPSWLVAAAKWAKANPALVSGAALVAATLLARFGFQLNANQITTVISALAAAAAGVTHVSTTPAGSHEAGQREEHG